MAGVANCCGYVGATLWLAVSSLVLGFLLAVYSPHIRSLFLTEHVCTIHEAIYTTQIRCDCGQGCRALFPCLEVHTKLGNATGDTLTSHWPVRLYIDDHKYIAVMKAATEDKEECCIEVCDPDTNKNRDTVELYRLKHAMPGMTHRCYYDPGKLSRGAFLHRDIHWTLAFHVILWPGLSVIGAIIMCFYIRSERRKRAKKRKLERRETRLQAQKSVEWDFMRSEFVYKERKDKKSPNKSAIEV